MQNTISMSIDLKRENHQNKIVQQNDDVLLDIDVYEEGKIKNLEGAIIDLSYVNANNTISIIAGNSMVVSGNNVKITCPRDCTRSAGVAKMKLTIVSDSKQVSTFPISITIVPDVLEGQEVSKNIATIIEGLTAANTTATITYNELMQAIELGNIPQLTNRVVNLEKEVNRIEPSQFIEAGDTCDVESINRMIQYASANNLVAFIPKRFSDYIINSPIYVPSNITLLSNGATIKLADKSNCRYCIVNEDRINGNSNIKIIGLRINANQTNQNDSLIIGNIIGICFESLSNTSACHDCMAILNYIYDSSIAIRSWVSDENLTGSRMHCYNMTFSHNTLEKCINKIIELGVTDRSLVSSNVCKQCTDGIQVIFNSNYNMVSNNIIECTATGLNITHNSCYNTFTNNYVSGYGYLLIMRADAQNTTSIIKGNKITNNTFQMSQGTGTIFSFSKLGSATGSMEYYDNDISNNSFLGYSSSATAFLRLYNFSSNDVSCKIDKLFLNNNTFANCAIVAGSVDRVNCTVGDIILNNNTYTESYVIPGKVAYLYIQGGFFKFDTLNTAIQYNSSSNPTNIFISDLVVKAAKLFIALTNSAHTNTISIKRCNVESASTSESVAVHNCNFFFLDNCDIITPDANLGVYFSNITGFSGKNNRIFGNSRGFSQKVGSALGGKMTSNEFYGTTTSYENMNNFTIV
ncbi:hypothetical protein [Clostridium cellulovorans]|uniref:Right handed beta helix domain-containing protein n=1 Tax=Clostridium cellulovorans (strain ATCC 35296 / DSM 3052 / OCM 3 / 743B) TaxID=573061 RepID=D9SPG1_CLOC7|nr:hypothetical protein [Clostridium cellulovorans]ADL50010.1 hypothetical protein Clocel_0226 [Clostridium cellulovorans 743B]